MEYRKLKKLILRVFIKSCEIKLYFIDYVIILHYFLLPIGIAGNWIWWNFAFSGLLTVFFFAKLWRRVWIINEDDFVVLRYSGKPARFSRGVCALYLGIFMNVVICPITLVIESILIELFGITEPRVMFLRSGQ